MPQNPNQQALESLKRLGAGVYQDVPNSALPQTRADDQTSLYGLQTSRQGELEDNMANALGTGDARGYARFAALLGNVRDDMAPVEADIAAQRKAQMAASLEGFTSPQEAAGVGRQMELTKIFAPVTAEQEKGRQQRLTVGAFSNAVQRLNGQANDEPGGGAPAPTPGAPATPPHSGKVYLDEQGNPLQSGQGGGQVAGGQDDTKVDFSPRPRFRMGMGPNGPTVSQDAYPRLTQGERTMVDNMRTAYRQLGEVRDIIKTNQGPNSPLAVDQPMRGGLGGFWDQIKSVGGAAGKRELYGLGFPDPTLTGDPKKADLYNKVTQLADLSKVMASQGMLHGMRNYMWVQDIQAHLAKGQQPTATQLERIQTIMQEYPKMIQDIYSTASGNAFQLPPQQ